VVLLTTGGGNRWSTKGAWGQELQETSTSLRTSSDHNDPNLHLLVDDAEIEHVENLTRVIQRPVKHDGPVMVADQPWEGDRVQAWALR